MDTYEENIVPIKISNLAEYISSVKRISLDDALVYIYINPMYEELYNEQSKWWYLSTKALYQEFEKRRNRQRLKVSKEVFVFYTYCLEKYAIGKHISGLRAWVDFKEYGVDDYIINNYDLLHTQGTEFILEDIHQYIHRRGKR